MYLFNGRNNCREKKLTLIKYPMRKVGIIFMTLLFLLSCKEAKKEEDTPEIQIEFLTPLGKEIILPEPSKKLLDQYRAAKEDFEHNQSDVDAIIWFGRRTAYLGRYKDAIALFSQGIKKFPKDARLYRHRGHRYISLRKFDKAIADLEKASQLIRNTENEIEPDGMPNAKNIPVSTLHGNIWYHLGLAYYLKHDYEKALEAYTKCSTSGKLADNIVSSTHWLYMIQRRLGNTEKADSILQPIQAEMDVIENQSYHELCKFYKGLIPIDALLQTQTGNPSSDAVLYGLANWHFYNDEKEKSMEIMENLVGGSAWSSFGYIAAESDLIEYFGRGLN